MGKKSAKEKKFTSKQFREKSKKIKKKEKKPEVKETKSEENGIFGIIEIVDCVGKFFCSILDIILGIS